LRPHSKLPFWLMCHAKVSFLADMAPSTPRKLPEMTKIPLLSSSSSQFFFHGGLPPSMVAGHAMTAARPRHPLAEPQPRRSAGLRPGGASCSPMALAGHRSHGGRPASVPPKSGTTKSEVDEVELPWRRGGSGVRQDRTPLAALGGAVVPEVELPQRKAYTEASVRAPLVGRRYRRSAGSSFLGLAAKPKAGQGSRHQWPGRP
jgi:hypothetical protein